MVSDWLKTKKKPAGTNQIRAVLTTKFKKTAMVFSNRRVDFMYILFKQASLTRKVMLFDKKPLCAYFLDLDECTTGSHSCDVNSVCQNTVGSYACSCNAGYTGDGKPCNGI